MSDETVVEKASVEALTRVFWCPLDRSQTVLNSPGVMSRGVEFYWMKVVPFPRRSLNPPLVDKPKSLLAHGEGDI
jgi:hypothetical protein